jgi:hypothetical protein
MNVEQIPWFGKLKICSFDLESSKTTVQEGDNGKISRFASDQEVLGHDGTGEISRFASDPRGLRHEDLETARGLRLTKSIPTKTFLMLRCVRPPNWRRNGGI